MCFAEYKRGCTTCWLNKTMVLMGHEGCVQNILRGSGYSNTQSYFLLLWPDYKMSPCWPKPAPNEGRGLSAGSRSACASCRSRTAAVTRARRAGRSATGARAAFAAKALLGHAQADPKISQLPPCSAACPTQLPRERCLKVASKLPRPLQPPASLTCSRLQPASPCQPHPGHLSHGTGTAISTTRRVSSLGFRARREGAQHAAGRWE